MLTEKKVQRSVWFYPEKRQGLVSIQKEKEGSDLERFKRTERNDILVTDYTSIKKLNRILGN